MDLCCREKSKCASFSPDIEGCASTRAVGLMLDEINLSDGLTTCDSKNYT